MLALFSFGLTAPERKALPQGNLAPGGNAPVPVDAEAEFLMGMGQCAVWCSANVAPWKTKCGWGSGYCSACSECSEHTIPHCGYWCPLHSGSWAEKCNWSARVCSGCTDCLDSSNAHTSGCESWCAGNGADWKTKCAWEHGHCAHCSSCGGSIQNSSAYP